MYMIPRARVYDEFYLNDCPYPIGNCEGVGCEYFSDNDCTHPKNPLEKRRALQRLQEEENIKEVHPK